MLRAHCYYGCKSYVHGLLLCACSCLILLLLLLLFVGVTDNLYNVHVNRPNHEIGPLAN